MSRHLPTQRGQAAPTNSTSSLKPSFPSHVSPVVKNGTQSGGQALDKHTSAEMSAKFGHDFSSIRIHTDARAEESAQAMGANAFALGGDIVFGAGKYNPGSPETDRLLAHELTHVVQQDKWGPGDWGRASRRGDASEREADNLASQVMMGRRVDVQAVPGAAIAREEADPTTSSLASVLSVASLFTGGPGLAGAASSLDAAGNAQKGITGDGPAATTSGVLGAGSGVLDLSETLGAEGMGAAASGLGAAQSATDAYSDFSKGNYGAGALDAFKGIGQGLSTAASAGGFEFAEVGGMDASAALAGGGLEGAAALGPLGAVIGAGMAGVEAGKGLDSLVNMAGQKITGDDKGDYSISNGLAHAMTATDNALDGGKAGKGLADLFTPTVDASGKQDTFMDRLGKVF